MMKGFNFKTGLYIVTQEKKKNERKPQRQRERVFDKTGRVFDKTENVSFRDKRERERECVCLTELERIFQGQTRKRERVSV